MGAEATRLSVSAQPGRRWGDTRVPLTSSAMLKPVTGSAQLTPPAPAVRPEARAVGPAPALDGATVHAPRGAFEETLRAALISLKEGAVRVEREADPLARHLGFRGLERELATGPAAVFGPSAGEGERSSEARGLEHLARPEEQQWARELLQTLRGGVERSFAALDEPAREDLARLLQQQVRARQWAEAQAQLEAVRRAAEQARTAARLVVERVAHAERREAALPGSRPAWQVNTGLVLAAHGLVTLLLVALQPSVLRLWARGLPGLSWGLLLGGLAALGAGAFWALDPRLRRAWLARQLAGLAELKRTHAEREAAAAAALARARKLFEEVDAECQREEAALRAVLARRPGVERYVNLAGPVVSFVTAGAAPTR
jgi:hypothetical protein